MEGYSQHVIFGFLLLTLAKGSLSEADCQQKTHACLTDALSRSGLSPQDTKDMKLDITSIMGKIAQLDICKFLQKFDDCHSKLASQCDSQVDETVKTMLKSLKMAEESMQCDQPEAKKCIELMNNCGINAFLASGISQEDLLKLQPPTDSSINPMDLIAQLGKGKGCKYVKGFLACTEAIDGQCHTVPLLQTSLVQMKASSDQLKCGRD